MSNRRFLHVTVQAALAAAMVLPMLAPGVQAAPFVSAGQQAQIVRDYTAAAPYGTWSKHIETQTFFLHSNCNTNTYRGGSTGPADPSSGSCPGAGVPAAGANQRIWYNNQLPPLASENFADEIQVGLSGGSTGAGPFVSASIPGAPNFTDGCSMIPKVLDDTNVFGFKVNFFAVASNTEENHFTVVFYDLDANCTVVPNCPNGIVCTGPSGALAGDEIGVVDARVAPGGAVGGGTSPGNLNNMPCDPLGASGLCQGYAPNVQFYSGENDVCARMGGNPVVPHCNGTYGYTLRAGHGIGMVIHANSDDVNQPDAFFFGCTFNSCSDYGNMVLLFDSRFDSQTGCGVVVDFGCTQPGYPSHFQVVADSVRINQWSEDRFGTVTNGFPPGNINNVPSPAPDRVVRWNAIQADTWGHQCRDTAFANNCVETTPEQPVNDGIEKKSVVLRVRDLTAEHQGAGYCNFQGDFCYGELLSTDQTLGLQGQDPGQDELTINCCDTANRPISALTANSPSTNCQPNQLSDGCFGLQRYRYPMAYPPTFRTGTYRLEFQDPEHKWGLGGAAGHTFFIGGSGFDFRFHDDEPRVDDTKTIADHLVALNQQTKYSVLLTNSGATTDTYGLAVPVPGAGWTAAVSPNQVTLAPGQFASVQVLVTPPSTAHAGDIKVVSVAATSIFSNQVKTLYTRTTYTAQALHGVHITSAVDLLEMRPGLGRVAPLAVFNNGTVKDDFIITTSGVPAGWSVGVSPPFMNILAASREDVSLSVMADPGADPGDSHTLNVKVCLIADSSVCDSVDIPVRVFLVFDLQVSTLPAVRDGVTTIRMRDAEFDWRKRSQQASCPNAQGFGFVADCWVIANKDTYFDDGAVFRVLVENRGDADESVDLTGAWDAPIYHQTDAPLNDGDGIVADAEDCDGTDDVDTGPYPRSGGDGVPDGWRFRVLGGPPTGTPGGNPFGASLVSSVADPGMQYPTPAQSTPRLAFDNAEAIALGWGNTVNAQPGNANRLGWSTVLNPTGVSTGFSGEYHVGSLFLPKHTSQYVYVELFWIPPTNGLNSADDNHPDECVAQPTYCTLLLETPGGCLGFIEDENFRHHMPSMHSFYRLSWRSSNDDALRGNAMLHAMIHPDTRSTESYTVPPDPIGARVNADGDDTTINTVHTVLLEPGIGQPTAMFAPYNEATQSAIGAFATFNMVATNTGNEYDDLKIEVDVGHNGWAHQVVSLPVQPAGTGVLPSGTGAAVPTVPPSCSSPTPDSCVPRFPRACEFSDGPPRVPTGPQQHLICRQVGVYDSVNFQARCTAPRFARIGDYDDMTIAVKSDRADVLGGRDVTSRITVRCILQGNFGYETDSPNPDLTGYRKQTIALPFSIHNTGLANDRYFVNIDSHVKPDLASAELAKDPWNPQLSSGSIVAVPSGFWWHGFLSVTVPATAQITEVEPGEPAIPLDHFRIKIQSLDGPQQTSRVLDFTVKVVEEPQFTLSADPVTIGNGVSDAIRIRATDCLPSEIGNPADCTVTGYTHVNFNASYVEHPPQRKLPALPRGFEWTCLPQNHPHFDATRNCVLFPIAPSATQSNEWEVTPNFSGARDAIQQLEISVPPAQLGTSRVAHRIQGTAYRGATVEVAYTDAIVNMKSLYGVGLNVTDDGNVCGAPLAPVHGCKVVPPGLNPLETAPVGVVFNVSVENTGLTPQNVLLTNSKLPDGWAIVYNTNVAQSGGVLGGGQFQSLQVQPPGYQANPLGPASCVGASPCVLVNPQDRTWVQVAILAPANAEAGKKATVIIFATVQEDTTKVAQLPLTAQVGEYDITLDMTPETYWVQPDEPARFTVTVTNTGTVTDNVDVNVQLPPAVASAFDPRWIPTASALSECSPDPRAQTVGVPNPDTCYIDDLKPGESRDVVLEISTPPLLSPTGAGGGYRVDLRAHSKLAPQAPVTASQARTIKVLDYVSYDVDGDGGVTPTGSAGREYAIDGCTRPQAAGCDPDPSDGYETFREALCACGIVSRSAPLAQFLDIEVKQAMADQLRLDGETYFIDANGDGHADHFIDTDGNGQPDLLWVPDYGGDTGQMVVTRINFTRDVTGDQLPELFIDLNLDRKYDMAFDEAKGQFLRLFQLLITDDQIADYVVDLDGDGERDPGETVLVGGPGGGVRGVIFNVDMNGDGAIDQAFDLDGDDGVPEYFVDGNCDSRLRTCASIKVTPQDVTGDGRIDWTYDHTGLNGRPDSYYDPNCRATDDKPCSGLIDTQAQFLRDLTRYWIIFALFVVALVLFVVLVVVTRRR